MITKHYTGHQYANSAYECDDNCGTCDGARCDFCKIRFKVIGIDKSFFNQTEAEKVETELRSLIPIDSKSYSDPEACNFFVKDGRLVVRIYVYGLVGKIGGYQIIPCNEASSLYSTRFVEAEERKQHYIECSCVNKDEEVDSNPCSIFGCTDDHCYLEMKHRNRTEKKWYM